MWQDKLKEIIYILENSNVNEIEVNFWGRKYRVSKQANVVVQDTSIPTERSPRSVQEYKGPEKIRPGPSHNAGNRVIHCEPDPWNQRGGTLEKEASTWTSPSGVAFHGSRRNRRPESGSECVPRKATSSGARSVGAR